MSNKIQIPAAAFDQHIIVLGKTRSGKSSAMRVLAEYLLGKQEPVTIIDPKGDWWGLKASADGKSAGFSLVIFGGDHGDVPLNPRSGGSVAELLATGNRSAIIDLGGWMPGDRTQFWIDFASTYFRTHKGRHHLIIDEVHNLAPKGKIMDPNAGKMLHWSNRLASEGLGKGISMIAASQRPQKVHNDFLTSCETLLAMRVIHKSDRDALKDWIDACGDPEKGKEVLATVASLSRGEAWAYSPEYEFGPKRVQFPMFDTYDSFRPRQGNAETKLKGWAEVDLADVTKKLESAIKEAEANDPKKLREEIRTLKAQLSAKPSAPAADMGKVKELEAMVRELNAYAGKTENFIAEQATAIGRAMKELQRMVDIQPPDPELRKVAKIIPKYIPAGSSFVNPKPATRENLAYSMGNGNVNGPQRKVLVALSELLSIGKEAPPKDMVAAWAGYSPSSGGYANLLSSLKSAGLADYPSGGLVRLTDAGRELIGVQDAPDAEEIQRRIRSTCSGPEQKIVAVLFNQQGPVDISKEDMAQESGYSPDSGGYANLLSGLRTKGLLDYPRPGFVRASDWLFEG